MDLTATIPNNILITIHIILITFDLVQVELFHSMLALNVTILKTAFRVIGKFRFPLLNLNIWFGQFGYIYKPIIFAM